MHNKKTGAHPYHDLNVLRPEMIAGVYNTLARKVIVIVSPSRTTSMLVM